MRGKLNPEFGARGIISRPRKEGGEIFFCIDVCTKCVLSRGLSIIEVRILSTLGGFVYRDVVLYRGTKLLKWVSAPPRISPPPR